MGLTTFAVALVPTTASAVGCGAAEALRLQGVGVGGEWGRIGAPSDGVGEDQRAPRLHASRFRCAGGPGSGKVGKYPASIAPNHPRTR
jgi:hypothetical protein